MRYRNPKNHDFMQNFSVFLSHNFQKSCRKSPRRFQKFPKNIRFCKIFWKVFPNEFLDLSCHSGRPKLRFCKKSWFFGFLYLILASFWPNFSLFLTHNFQKSYRKSPRRFQIFQKNIRFCKTFWKVFPNKFLDSSCHPGPPRMKFCKKMSNFPFHGHCGGG